jgi:hypothetical protein
VLLLRWHKGEPRENLQHEERVEVEARVEERVGVVGLPGRSPPVAETLEREEESVFPDQ